MYFIELTRDENTDDYNWDSEKWFHGLCDVLNRQELDALLSLLALICASHPVFMVCYRTEDEIADLIRVPVDVLRSCMKKALDLGKISVKDGQTTNKILYIPGLPEDQDDDESDGKKVGLPVLFHLMRTLVDIREDFSCYKKPTRQADGGPVGSPESRESDNIVRQEDSGEDRIGIDTGLPLFHWQEDQYRLQEAMLTALDDLYKALGQDIIYNLFQSDEDCVAGRPFRTEELVAPR